MINSKTSYTMKKALSILMIALAFAFAGCGQKQANPSQNNGKETPGAEAMAPAAQYDFLYLEAGNIWFYNLDTHEADRYVNEPDSIIDMVCSKNNMLYYNVAQDNNVVLKCLNLNLADPMPEQLAGWDVAVNRGEQYYPQQYGDMYFNCDESQIALQCDVNWFAGMYYNLAVYDIAAKSVNRYKLYRVVEDEDGFSTLEDLPDESGFRRWCEDNAPGDAMQDLFEEEGGNYYYVGDGQRICLTDKIDMMEAFGIDLEEGFEYDIPIMDPTGKKVLFAPHAYMGDGELGFYFVSSLDGKQQMVLPGSSYGETDPEWLPDGSLVFPGYIDDVGLFLLEPNNNIRFIAESDVFGLLH